jgi:hypothetical protein
MGRPVDICKGDLWPAASEGTPSLSGLWDLGASSALTNNAELRTDSTNHSMDSACKSLTVVCMARVFTPVGTVLRVPYNCNMRFLHDGSHSENIKPRSLL